MASTATTHSWNAGLREARAELMKEGWEGGETVTQLAKRFGVARDTVYRDLATQGINPRKIDSHSADPVIHSKPATTESDHARWKRAMERAESAMEKWEGFEPVTRAEFDELKAQVEWLRQRSPMITYTSPPAGAAGWPQTFTMTIPATSSYSITGTQQWDTKPVEGQ